MKRVEIKADYRGEFQISFVVDANPVVVHKTPNQSEAFRAIRTFEDISKAFDVNPTQIGSMMLPGRRE